MADNVPSPSVPKASWDETNIGIFLQCLVDEIDAENRPGGQFTKQAWSTVTTKFQELSGCKFTQTQLKNKWDNLKKDFSLWEKLLHDETGLGYDYATGRVTADPAWWRTKIQEKPEYRRFKTHGPVQLELQERVFRGQVATGYMEYIPVSNVDVPPPQTQDEQGDQVIADQENINADDGQQANQMGGSVPCSRVTARTGGVAKRRRSRSSNKNPSQGDVTANMMNLIDRWHEQAESTSSVRHDGPNGQLSYEEALSMLNSLPWMDDTSEEYLEAMVILEDPIKRIALRHIKDKPEEFVKGWIKKHQELQIRRNY